MTDLLAYKQRAARTAVPGHIVINLSDVNSSRNTPIFMLNDDILITIFSMLGRAEPALLLENNHFGSPSLTRVLLCVALVCKKWSSIASGMLFKRSQIGSHDALRFYIRELKAAQKRGTSLSFISSFAYFPPLMELADSLNGSPNKIRPQERRQDNKDLREALSLIPKTAALSLKASPTQFMYLMKQSWFRAADLITLHIAHPSTAKEVANLPNDLPNLRTLILQNLRASNSCKWPTAPKLEVLRLINVELEASTDPSSSGEIALEPFKNLRKVEFIDVHYADGELKPFLRQSSNTLEYLSLVNVGGPDFSTLIYDLGFLQALRGLCIGPYAFKAGAEQQTPQRGRFPESLGCLTIWQLLKPRLTEGTLPSFDNVAGLTNFLVDVRFRNPNLHTIRMRGADYELGHYRTSLSNACTVAGVTLEMSTFKCEHH